MTLTKKFLNEIKRKNKILKEKVKKENSRFCFRCPECGNYIKMFPGCKIKEMFCSYKYAEHKPCVKMVRVDGFCCEFRPDLDNKTCDYCGCCDTGTDEDFDRYAVQVQNGDGYYDAAGNYVSYDRYID